VGDTVNKKKRFSKLKKAVIVITMLLIAFWGYVEIVNQNSKKMTTRQKILKAVYPAFVWITKLTGKNSAELSNAKVIPPKVSIYDLSVQLNNNTQLRLDSLKGKKILLVNTASDCGYTAQYDDLQKLYEQFKDKLVIIGFPANDFKEQEKGTDEEIASFCKLNFGVTFPLAKKSVVVKGQQQNEIFQWLTDAAKNGWNDKAPVWNFSKYLVNEQGVLMNYFEPSVSPLNEDVLAAINK
jgi:glutathione peroxidase